MRYVQLRAFHNVAIHGGFSRAAEALFLTQPAVSDQVRKLEEEYDVLLFNRNKKQVTLTQAGQQLLEVTRRMFDVEQQALDLLSESRALRAGKLRIVADAAHHLLHILAAFRRAYPTVQVSIDAGNTETVITSLHAYEADIGVLGEVPQSSDFEILKLNSTPIIAFASRDYPLAGQRTVTFPELATHPLVMRERGSKTRQKLEAMAAVCGVSLTPLIEAEGREAVREIVAAGGGVGFVSSAEFGQDNRLVPIPIDAPEMLMDEALICLRERANGKLVNAFFDIARKLAPAAG
ncbi:MULTISPECIES: LysR substrate-binding domain-containing protein [unclassified Shinella]|jgi:aminoethylphosphonate catabolism LysR family transcriptional regulator|uniref:LysR substrate-binding domain-containing protein n=1 Tax=unclassified Shinella TaxID=2643062 RepID=UPI0003C5598F|nr:MULTISPECIES: LysR substrate-binding domain-containing protein [unclassified Shinella]EYR81472.1 HTH-type transcriptional activator CmpR [Shinella sp. DD12]MCO5151783.1 LysR substrate-binding domain-containing protein [Shinella sp.]MDC7266460.1 LysR family transcriptional regulator [Shinella sp. HY16]MDC7273357.1 LysR family transcriptional regulator [Shinella sp. YZ44]MDG4675061.1 LysR substrate-binding domain-containing protein [Shinella sp. 838]